MRMKSIGPLAKKRLTYLEQFVFFGMAIIGCWAFLSETYFFTNDGAAHVYSATILNDLIFNSDSMYAPYFEINTFPTPNWLGHFLLFFLVPVFGGIIAEKILIIIIVVGCPIALRFFLQKRGQNIIPAYILILTTHRILFYFGFYNFSLGILVLLVTLIFTPLPGTTINRKRLILLAVMYLLLYFSHLFVLFVAVAFQIALIFDSINGSFKTRFQTTLKHLSRIAISFLPAFILSLIFLFSNNGISGDLTYSAGELWKRFQELWGFTSSFTIQPIAPFETYTQSVWCVILIVFGCVIVTLIRKRRELRFSAWFVITLALLVAYFVVPDSGLYISIRLFILFFLSFYIWMSTIKIPQWVVIPVLALVFFIQREMQFSAMSFHNESQKYVESVVEMENFIPKGAAVGIINHSVYWLERGHSHNYIGLNKKVIDVCNYEATLSYFPIRSKGVPWEVQQFQNDDREILEPLRTNYGVDGKIDLKYIILIKDKSFGQGHTKKENLLKIRGYKLFHGNEIADLYKY